MKYLIDTDISSYCLRGKFNLFNVFETKGLENISLSRISIAELEVLAHKNPSSSINLSTIDSLSENLGVIEVDQKTWRLFSTIKATLSKKGVPRGDFDILNASIAIQHDMIIVTNNVKHYEDIVACENWTTN
ncbi:MAG TPA: type II toxin-antitoxin system VapC family toxin [Nitrospirae bacterium]|nr:type II toxin-antitoxin system VapC family toxin [Nitrospirota bacterium]HDZ84058.1 type II toxin-antitoxin system VapC family toxin [Nitrospirota bacterium]